jgi:hypothetical protein
LSYSARNGNLQENDGVKLGNYVKYHRKNLIFGFLAGMNLCWLLLACAAPAAKMKCEEISYRINHEALDTDQKSFLEQELKDCQQQVQSAGQNDSAKLNGLQNSISPSSKSSSEDSL